MKKTRTFLLLLSFCFYLAARGQNTYVFPGKIKPLISTRWGQGPPFNLLTPAIEVNGERVRPLAGCGAVGMAQIINYHEYPNWSPDRQYEYEWRLMYNRVVSGSELRRDQLVAVAKLISDCGVSAFTDFGVDASSTNLSNMQNGLKRLYGYSDYMCCYQRSQFDTPRRDSLFRHLIFEELKAGRPILYRGEKPGQQEGGHLFIIDGCKGGLVHANMGWAGRQDDYYALDDLNGYSQEQWMLIGVADTTFRPDILTVKTEAAGTLATLLTTAAQECTQHIAVSGPLDSADLLFLRKMLEGGVLCTIDLGDAEIEAISEGAFIGCHQLAHIVLPRTCSRIEGRAFEGCWNLNRVIFPDSLHTIGAGAFLGCSNLFSPRLPKALRVIGPDAFYRCESIVHIYLPEGVCQIGSNAFSYSKNLISVYLPASLSQSASQLVNGCPKLKRFTIAPDNPHYIIEGHSVRRKP